MSVVVLTPRDALIVAALVVGVIAAGALIVVAWAYRPRRRK